MKKVILVDGNNLLFRSYYATAYTGNFMKNSKGFPTNALFGFSNMINKIIKEEKPVYMIVAFDKGKTFRHEKYETYKDGRSETPNELKMQFPKAKELLEAMGVKYYEIDNYEADDIIGTFANFCDSNPEYYGTIVSSDKDLLQLISPSIDIKLLKQKDYIRYNEQSFIDAYGIDPINIIDLKSLQGDPSDNIPGVKGIGEKTALKLLQEYKTLDNIYLNIDKHTPSIRKKLNNDKENAYLSYELATIVKNIKMDISMDDLKYDGPTDDLNIMYEDLEFYSLIKNNKLKKEVVKNIEPVIVKSVDDINITKDSAFYLETLAGNYHSSKIIGLSIYNDTESYYIEASLIKECFSKIVNYLDYTYDLKKAIVILSKLGLDLDLVKFDTMIAASMLEYNLKDDVAYLANILDYDVEFYENIYGKVNKEVIPSTDILSKYVTTKAMFVYDSMHDLKNKLNRDNMSELFETIEMPLISVLANMELSGINVVEEELDNMGTELRIKIELLKQSIYNHAGCEFNIASPKELGIILFETLNLPHGKKTTRGYSTAIEVLEKLVNSHPIIKDIIEFRMLSKLEATYITGLKNNIINGKIHTIYTQTMTRTGRLSSVEPNLQNIPARNEYGRKIKKAFVPSIDSVILTADYSQIELRIFSHIAKIESLIDAFNKEEDIHTKTASDIFNINILSVTDNERRVAKAVNFGILYGISSYGLSTNLNIPINEAKEFIDKYFLTYPGIKEYMDTSIKIARDNLFVTTLMNRKRVLTELTNPNYMIRSQAERMALNTPIQGTSADIIKKAMVEVSDYIKENNLKSKLILQVHDELIIDCKKDELEIVKKCIKEIMENTYKIDVPLKVDINYGDNWYNAK